MRQCLYTARGGIGFQSNLLFLPFMMYLKMIALYLVTIGVVVTATLLALVAIIPFIAIIGVISNMNPPMIVKGIVTAICVVCCVIEAVFIIVYPMVRLYLAPWFLLDRDTGILNSLTDAWQVSSGNVWRLFVVLTVYFACIFCWTIPCMLVLEYVGELDSDSVPRTLLTNAGSIFLVGIIWLGSSLAYLRLTGQPYCPNYATEPAT
jgi:hypothetical protein